MHGRREELGIASSLGLMGIGREGAKGSNIISCRG